MKARTKRRIRQGLLEAIEARESLIDAHRKLVGHRQFDGEPIRVFIPRFYQDVRRWRRDIAAWRRVLRELDDL